MRPLLVLTVLTAAIAATTPAALAAPTTAPYTGVAYVVQNDGDPYGAEGSHSWEVSVAQVGTRTYAYAFHTTYHYDLATDRRRSVNDEVGVPVTTSSGSTSFSGRAVQIDPADVVVSDNGHTVTITDAEVPVRRSVYDEAVSYTTQHTDATMTLSGTWKIAGNDRAGAWQYGYKAPGDGCYPAPNSAESVQGANASLTFAGSAVGTQSGGRSKAGAAVARYDVPVVAAGC